MPEPDIEFGPEANRPHLYYLKLTLDTDNEPCYIIHMRPQLLIVMREDDKETVFLGRIDHFAPDFHTKLWDIILKDFQRPSESRYAPAAVLSSPRPT